MQENLDRIVFKSYMGFSRRSNKVWEIIQVSTLCVCFFVCLFFFFLGGGGGGQVEGLPMPIPTQYLGTWQDSAFFRLSEKAHTLSHATRFSSNTAFSSNKRPLCALI